MSDGADLLVLSGVLSPEDTLSGATYTVKFNGKPLAVNFESVRIPHDDIPGTLEIEADPGGDHFAVSGRFRYEGRGKLVEEPGTTAGAFAPVRAAVAKANFPGSALPATAMSMIVFFSRLRLATEKALPFAHQGKKPKGPAYPKTPGELDATVRATANVSVVQQPPVAGGTLSFARQDVTPRAELHFFELKADPAPKLLAVLWPDSIVPSAATANDPVPYLIYVHPNTGQNHPKHYAGDYPFSHDFIHYQLIRYLIYGQSFAAADPTVKLDPLLESRAFKGLAHQFEVAGKPVVLVKPVLRPHVELGVMLDADHTEWVLREIGALMFRRAGVFASQPPPIGRVGMAAFSAGNALAIQFLRDNKGHPFVDDTLREYYGFDCPAHAEISWFKHVKAWRGPGKHAAYYNQRNSTARFAELLPPGTSIPATRPHVTANAGGTTDFSATMGSMGIKEWQAVTPMKIGWQDAHQLIPGLLLTDALRRSGY